MAFRSLAFFTSVNLFRHIGCFVIVLIMAKGKEATVIFGPVGLRVLLFPGVSPFRFGLFP